MNVIFISPNYPEGHWRYVQALRGLGVNVLGIGDAVEENFPHGLKGGLTGYYKVEDLRNYDAVYRAIAFFSYNYGRPDAIESLNGYWAELEAGLRRDFNVVGFDVDYARRVYNDEAVRETIRGLGVKCAFTDTDRADLPSGRIIRASGFANRYGKLAAMELYEFSDLPQNIADKKELLYFFSADNAEVKALATKIVGEVGIKGGFFNLTFLSGDENILLDVNFLPPEEYFSDAAACGGGSDLSHIWAADRIGASIDYHSSPDILAYVTRRFDRSYRYSHDRVMSKIKQDLRRQGRSYSQTDITGDYFYIFRAESEEKAREMAQFIQMDYSDIGPTAQFPALKAVKPTELRQTAIREKSSYDARRLLSRKVNEKIRHEESESAYERDKGHSGVSARSSAPSAKSKKKTSV